MHEKLDNRNFLFRTYVESASFVMIFFINREKSKEQ